MSKKGITQETPLQEMNEIEYIRAKVKLHLKKKPLTTYTIGGLMIQLFGTREININQKFPEWNKRDRMLYTEIKKYVEELVETGLVRAKFEGKGKRGNYWWVTA